MHRNIKLKTLMLTTAVATLAMGQSAFAQSVAQASDKETAGTDLGDIVVTATRREQRLQDVPVAVTAVTAEALGRSGAADLRNLTQVVPGFFGGRAAGVFLPVIRGVGSNSISVGDESNIATYVDGVYQGDPFSTWTDLVKVDRVEVLRGPQGTIFGRNATGGLINVITPDPSFEFGGLVSARAASIETGAGDYNLRGYLTGGLSDTLAADVAAIYRKTDGFVDDLVRGGKAGGYRVVDIRSKIMHRSGNGDKIVLMGEYFDRSGSENVYQPYENNTAGRAFPGVILASKPGKFRPIFGLSCGLKGTVWRCRPTSILAGHISKPPAPMPTTRRFRPRTQIRPIYCWPRSWRRKSSRSIIAKRSACSRPRPARCSGSSEPMHFT